MCLPLDYWLCCMSRTVNDDPAPARRTRTGGASYYTGNGYHATAAEAYRKAASDDVRRGPAAHHAGAVVPVAATRGWHGHHAPATGAQEKIAVAAYPYARAEETLKQQPLIPAAWNGRVAAADGGYGARGGAPHNYYYERAQLPAHRGAAADSHYTAAAAAAATADHERY